MSSTSPATSSGTTAPDLKVGQLRNLLRDGTATNDPPLTAVRRMLQRQRRCAGHHSQPRPEALRAYHREWDDADKCFRETPVHDWASHTADAFRYMAVVVEREGLLTRPAPVKPASQPPKAWTWQDDPTELHRRTRGGRERL